jgi:hypothetical protein
LHACPSQSSGAWNVPSNGACGHRCEPRRNRSSRCQPPYRPARSSTSSCLAGPDDPGTRRPGGTATLCPKAVSRSRCPERREPPAAPATSSSTIRVAPRSGPPPDRHEDAQLRCARRRRAGRCGARAVVARCTRWRPDVPARGPEADAGRISPARGVELDDAGLLSPLGAPAK